MIYLDPLTDPLWDEKILAHENASIFHTAGWALVLRDTYGFSCSYLLESKGDQILFLLPLMEVRSYLTGRRGISLPFTDYCEPIMSGDMSGETVLNALVTRGRQRGWKYFEVRGGERLFKNHPAATILLRHTLDLTFSEEALFAKIKDSTRRNIRKAKNQGVEIGIGSSLDMVEAFYRLNCLTRREHGLPPQPLSFFRNLHKHILARGYGVMALARVRNQAIGGAIFLHFGGNTLYKYGASDHRFLSLRPNDLLMWEAIRWYHSRGFRTLCFGRTELPHHGLRRFKMGWGGKESRLRYLRFDMGLQRFTQVKAGLGETASKMVRRLPIPLLRMVGRALYRHVA